MGQPNINKKCPINEEADNETYNNIDKKTYLKQFGLKREVISDQA